MKTYLVTSAFFPPLNGEAPPEVMYMPAGKSNIKPSVNGKAKQISVNVTEATAEVLQASLAGLLTEPVSPFVDFNHKGEDSAATPIAFRWDDRGVMMALDWSAAGRSAVEGKVYKHISPTFLINEAGEPCGLPPDGPIAALTNRPAFKRNATISASDEGAQTGDDEPPKQRKKHMAEEATETVMAALKTELETLRTENKTLHESIEKQRVEAVNREADLLIEGAVRDRKIAPKDEKLKAGLKKLYQVDADAAKEAIESMPVNAAFKTVINTKVGDRDIGKPPGASRATEMNSIVRKIQASHPGMDWDAAWSLAEADHPDIFGTSKVQA